MKQNYKDMLLESASGYMMPFPLEEKDNIQATLAFGEQNHPLTGEKFFHKGIDFPASDKSWKHWETRKLKTVSNKIKMPY